MPRVATEIPETYEAIIRPVALEVVRAVCRFMNLQDGVTILFPGASEEAPMTGTTLDSDNPNPSTFGHGSRVRVEVSEQVVEDRVLTTAVHQVENLPIFLDPEIGVLIKPIYSGTELVLGFSYRADSRVAARKFRDQALLRTSSMAKENMHEISYHYAFPAVFIRLLKQIWTMREAVAGYDESFDEWMVKYLDERATNVATLTGQSSSLAIAETQVCPWGYFSDFNAIPEPESKDKESGTWFVNFEYRITFDKVVACAAEWPLVVHNQLIPFPWREKPNASGSLIDPDRRDRAPSRSRRAFDIHTNIYTDWCKKKVGGITIPEYDDYEPASIFPNTTTVAMMMMQVDADDPHAVINLGELGDYSMDPEVLEFLRLESPYINHLGASVFHVGLYAGRHPMPDGSLVASELDVRSVDPMHLRHRYHLRIALMCDLFELTSEAATRLRNAGPACVKILSALQWNLMGNAIIPKLVAGRIVSREDFNEIALRINRLKYPRHNGLEHVMFTVGNYLITTNRSSEYALDEAGRRSAGTGGSTSTSSGGDPIPGCDG